jgi:hypothetical protein
MTLRLVLVHSPLVGPGTWRAVAGILAGDGYPVAVPDLTGTVAAGPPFIRPQAETIARAAGDGPCVLAGHSGAGPLLAAAGPLAGQVQGYLFVDAGLPTPGRSWRDTVPAELSTQLREMADDQGWLPPWSQWWGDEELAGLLPDPGLRREFAAECPRLPLAMFEEVHPPAPAWPDAAGGYLLLSEAYEPAAAEAAALGWPCERLITDHLAPLTRPAPVAIALRGLLDQLPR